MQIIWSEQNATIIGSVISGAMTICAGYLAFRETQKTNRISNNAQAQILLLERIKAVNIVRAHVFEAIDKIVQINSSVIDGKTMLDISSDESVHYALAHQSCCSFKENFPVNFDFRNSLADSLAVLPDEVANKLQKVVEVFVEVMEAFDANIYPVNLHYPALASDKSHYQKALRAVCISGHNQISLLEKASSSLREPAHYLLLLKAEYRAAYDAIIERFIKRPR